MDSPPSFSGSHYLRIAWQNRSLKTPFVTVSLMIILQTKAVDAVAFRKPVKKVDVEVVTILHLNGNSYGTTVGALFDTHCPWYNTVLFGRQWSWNIIINAPLTPEWRPYSVHTAFKNYRRRGARCVVASNAVCALCVRCAIAEKAMRRRLFWVELSWVEVYFDVQNKRRGLAFAQRVRQTRYGDVVGYSRVPRARYGCAACTL